MPLSQAHEIPLPCHETVHLRGRRMCIVTPRPQSNAISVRQTTQLRDRLVCFRAGEAADRTLISAYSQSFVGDVGSKSSGDDVWELCITRAKVVLETRRPHRKMPSCCTARGEQTTRRKGGRPNSSHVLSWNFWLGSRLQMPLLAVETPPDGGVVACTSLVVWPTSPMQYRHALI